MYPNIEIFHRSISTYLLAMIVSFVLSYLVAKKINQRYQFLPKGESLFSLFVLATVSGLVGAKLLFIVTQIPIMIKDTKTVIPIFLDGGMVFYGGLIFGILSLLWYFKKYKIDSGKALDLFAIVIPFAHMIGRIGCFLAGCCYGKQTNAWYGMLFPYGSSTHIHGEGARVIPTQLIEAILLFSLFVFLFVFHRLAKYKKYRLSSLYLMLYGVIRFLLEFLRGDEIRGRWLFLSTSQWISILIILAGMIFYRKSVFSLGEENETI